MITFAPYPHNILRVFYKNVYLGRIIPKDDVFEWVEKGRLLKAHISNKQFDTLEHAKLHVTMQGIARQKSNNLHLETTLQCLTSKGRKFIKQFLVDENEAVKGRELSKDERNVANHFVLNGLLEKSFSITSKDMLFYTQEHVRRKIVKNLKKS